MHNIVPLFVPAGCTDELQECDTVVNKPFKASVRGAFRDYLDDLFQKHIDGGRDPITWEPKLTVGALKQHITSFVQKGISCLKTPNMKNVIQDAFAKHGLFEIMRSDERQLIAQMNLSMSVNETVIFISNEEEDNVDDFEPIYVEEDSDSDTEDD
jgi:hypothetical protein